MIAMGRTGSIIERGCAQTSAQRRAGGGGALDANRGRGAQKNGDGYCRGWIPVARIVTAPFGAAAGTESAATTWLAWLPYFFLAVFFRFVVFFLAAFRFFAAFFFAFFFAIIVSFHSDQQLRRKST
jgi:hypothetical protein